LWRDKRWLIGAGVAGLVIGFLWVKLVMRSPYETLVVLKYEGDLGVSNAPASKHALGPAADALVRQSVLRKIQEESGFEGSLTGLAASMPYEIDLLAGTVQITVSGETGEDAAEFARIVTDVFMTYHKERQSRRIEGEIVRTGKRIAAAEDESEEARHLYDEFRDLHGIADLSTEQHSMVKSAAELRAESELAAAEIRAYEAQVRSLETQLASTPKTSFVSGGASPERATYDRLRGELASAQATLSPSHPRVQALEQQVTHLRSQLRSGGGTSSSGGLVGVNATYQVVEGQLREAKSSLEALRERQKGLSAMADKAQHRVEAFSDIEGEAAALLAEVQVNESLVGKLRGSEAVLEDALRDPPSGFVVLDPGATPEDPVRNKMKVVVFAAIPSFIVGFVLFIVLRREFRGLLLETPAEVAFWGNGPVLGATSWPNDLQSLDELVAGLDDFIPNTRGSLLIVGGSVEESRIASELADRMNTDWFPTNARSAPPSAPPAAPDQRAPLQTPAPSSGPYPIGGSSSHSLALVRRPSAPPAEAIRLTSPAGLLQLEAWEGPQESQALRRAARIADRVVVLVRSCAISAPQLNGIQNRVGRERGIGYIVVGLPDELHTLPDRVGDVAAFWRS